MLQVHLSGGEPAARRDLADIVKAAREAGLYSNLITSAVGLTPQTLNALADAGLDHVQISIQDSEEKSADHIAGYDGASARKRALAAEVVKLGLPLTVNMVVHRANIARIEAMVELALSLGAARVEIAHVQYYGWALKNRAALMPTREQVEQAVASGRIAARRNITAASSSTRWCRIITRASRNPASAAGAAARSMSRRPARCCPATPPRSFRGSNSGTCASIRSATSGGLHRPSMRSAAPTGCRSRAKAAPAASRISAAAAARPS